MRLLALAALGAAACTAEPNEYPSNARAQFAQSCPTGETLCDCTWEEITRAMPFEDYAAALARYRQEGLMDPRITRARTTCLERQ